MPPVDKSPVDPKELQKFYTGEDAARAVLDHFANRERNQNTSTVRRLKANVVSDGFSISRGQTVKVLKKLESLGCGDFKAGRKGHESRFEWRVSSKSVGQVAAGEDTEIEQDVPLFEESAEEIADELIEHRYQLRPELSIVVGLPSDLSAREAKRLATFIETLPFSTGE